MDTDGWAQWGDFESNHRAPMKIGLVKVVVGCLKLSVVIAGPRTLKSKWKQSS